LFFVNTIVVAIRGSPLFNKFVLTKNQS